MNNSISFPLPLFRLFLAFLLLILVKSSAVPAYPDEWFFKCKESTNCEGIDSKELPFWSYDGTRNCGHQELKKVNCEGSYATIEMLGAKYKVLRFDSKDQILIIAKTGIPEAFCYPEYRITPRSIYAMIPVTSNCWNNSQYSEKPACSDTEFSYIPFEKWAQYPPHDYCLLSVIVPISPLFKKHGDDWEKVAQNMIKEFNSGRKAQIRESCSVVNGVYNYGYELEFNQTRCYCQSSSNGFELCRGYQQTKHRNQDFGEFDYDIEFGESRS